MIRTAGLIAACLLAAWMHLATASTYTLTPSVQLGPRPFYLVDQMDSSDLKKSLARCAAERTEYQPSDFSIGHRGAPLQFPEHTRESYLAAARMGAGILECDVAFTRDKELVCRHAQCDLHTTTNILETPLASKCSEGFTPAEYDADGNLVSPASARCCTSDITLAEFKTLKGKMDAADSGATTVDAYLGGTADFRTDLYATGGTLMTHAESIELFRSLGRKMTPELKSPEVPMPFDGFTQQDYAQKLIDEYLAAGIPAEQVWPQSFNLDDVLYWIDNTAYGAQAVYLEGRNPVDLVDNPPALSFFAELKARGVQIIAPPMSALLDLNQHGRIAPSLYAQRARQAGLDIISWTTERSGRIAEDVVPAGGSFYYDTTVEALHNDFQIYRTMHVLARGVGIIGLFSDWPATTTFYANCMNPQPPQ